MVWNSSRRKRIPVKKTFETMKWIKLFLVIFVMLILLWSILFQFFKIVKLRESSDNNQPIVTINEDSMSSRNVISQPIDTTPPLIPPKKIRNNDSLRLAALQKDSIRIDSIISHLFLKYRSIEDSLLQKKSYEDFIASHKHSNSYNFGSFEKYEFYIKDSLRGNYVDQLEELEKSKLSNQAQLKTFRETKMILDTVKILSRRRAEIRKDEKELKEEFGATTKEVQDVFKEKKMSEFKEKLNQYPDFHNSNLYLLFPPKTKKWKTYSVTGTLHQILDDESVNLDNEMLSTRPDSYIVSAKKQLQVPNLVRLRISGSRFDITPVSEEWQSTESIYYCTWLWEIIPIERDKQAKLFFVLEGKNDAGQVFPIASFTEEVRISGGYWKDVINHWQWWGNYVFLPIIGWLVLSGKWKIALPYLKRLFKRTKVVKVEEVQKEEQKEGESGK